MCLLFKLSDQDISRQRWVAWFEAAKDSGIQLLNKFIYLIERLVDGLVSHSSHQIRTVKPEGINNRIKVAKHIGFDTATITTFSLLFVRFLVF